MERSRCHFLLLCTFLVSGMTEFGGGAALHAAGGAPSVSIRRLLVSDRVVPGDFNGDGIVDLAATNNFGISGGVVVALGKGDGTFNPPQTAPVIAGRASPRAISTATQPTNSTTRGS